MTRRRRVAALLAGAMLLGEILSAGNTSGVEAKATQTFTIYRGKSAFLTITQKGKKTKLGKKYRYRVANKKIATISAKGKVKGKKAGTTKVTLQKKSSKKKITIKIKVVDYVKELRLSSATNIMLKAGEKKSVKAVVYPTTAKNRKVVYTSSNKSIATVSSTGTVQAVQSGFATITATTKGTTKKGKKLSKKIYIYVSEETTPVPTPNVPDAGATVIGGGSTPKPGASNTPTPGSTVAPGATATPAPTERPKTLEEAIKEIPAPDASTLVAATFVAQDGNATSTLYFINRNYQGTMHVAVDGADMSSSSSVTNVLHKLETEVLGRNIAVYTGPGDIFRVTRPNISDAWGIRNTSNGNEYRLMAWEKDTKYGTPYGLIITEGDTTSNIVVY